MYRDYDNTEDNVIKLYKNMHSQQTYQKKSHGLIDKAHSESDQNYIHYKIKIKPYTPLLQPCKKVYFTSV